MTPIYNRVNHDENVTYSMIATNYLIADGDGYDMIVADVKHELFGTLDYNFSNTSKLKVRHDWK